MPTITALQAELGRVAFTVVVVGSLAIALGVLGWVRRRGAHRTATTVAVAGLVVIVLGVLSLTLFGPVPPDAAQRQLYLDPVEGARGWTKIAWNPVIDNIALFVPVGAMAGAVWWRRSIVTVWAGCVLFSIAIETFQFLVPTGRVANAADVVANGVGAAIGIVLAVALGARAAAARSGRAAAADAGSGGQRRR